MIRLGIMESDTTFGCPVRQPGSPVTQFSVFLENRVGSLMRVVKFLHDHKISVLGLSSSDSADASMVRLIVSDPDSVTQSFIEKGIPFSQVDVVVVALQEADPDMEDMLECLHEAGINVNFIYPLYVRPGSKSCLVMHVDNPVKASDVLLAAGLAVLYQEDISR